MSTAATELTTKHISRNKRIERFKSYFRNHFAVEGIGKWILGRYWWKASKKEQDEYLLLFEQMMVFLLVDKFSSYEGEQLQIKSSVIQDENNVTIFSNFQPKYDKPAIRVDWRVARSNNIMKVVDVIIEGTSISDTLRSDFRSIIRSHDYSVSGLLKMLRRKNSTLSKQTEINNKAKN